MIPRVSKTHLKNIIHHTAAHNRYVEEDECWRLYGLPVDQRTPRTNASSPRRSPCGARGELMDDRGHAAHMDSLEDVRPRVYDGREERTGTFWLRQLDKAETADPDRWGHSGYKELYPHDFESDSELPNNEDPSSTKRRRRSTSTGRSECKDDVRKSAKKTKKKKRHHKSSEKEMKDICPKKHRKKKRKESRRDDVVESKVEHKKKRHKKHHKHIKSSTPT